MPTTEDLLNLANGVGQRRSEILFEVLDKQLQRIGYVQPDVTSDNMIENNTNRAIKRMLKGIRLNSSVQADIDPFGNRIRPVWVLENGATFNLGVFIPASLDRARHEYGLDANLTGVDQCLILDQPLDHTVGYPAGASVRAALIEQFEAAGVPVYDVDTTIATTIANPIAWPAGRKTRMDVMNDLAGMASAYSIYFDNDGTGKAVRVPDLATATSSLIYESGGRIYADSMVETDDLLDSPNEYVVIDSGAPDAAIIGTFKVPSSALFSELNRGFVVSKVIEEQGLANATDADGRAAAVAAQDAGTYQWVQFSGPPDPRHDTFDVVQYLGVNYREQAWTLPLIEGGEMRHDLRRIYSDG